MLSHKSLSLSVLFPARSVGWQYLRKRRRAAAIDTGWTFLEKASGSTCALEALVSPALFRDVHGHSKDDCNHRWCFGWCSLACPHDLVASLSTAATSQTQSSSATPSRRSRTHFHSTRIRVVCRSTGPFQGGPDESPDFLATWWLWHS